MRGENSEKVEERLEMAEMLGLLPMLGGSNLRFFDSTRSVV